MARTASLASLGSLALILLAACGPAPRDGGGDDGGGGGGDVDAPVGPTCTPTGTTETACGDGVDEDCDFSTDCGDPDCFGIAGCPDGGGTDCEVETPSISFPLPDGVCTNANDVNTCSAYEGIMNLSGFAAGATLDDPSKLLAICVNMEHSWLRDLEIEAYCPDGNKVVLSDFAGRVGGEVYLGQANDGDSSQTPVPGVGFDYCWKPAAGNPAMIVYANATGVDVLPAGDYQPSEPFTGFAGCSLNGAWKLRVVDAWGADNGFIFGTSMIFDSSLGDCPIIE
ncbi:MAG: hypothetical protein KBG28_15485 [Kofleriaceae bacterium]|nr:hypothetical protein [Kofleriaceae bacterium]MBP9205372.1 hypothetical protein [Kofleriaceae bacterium]